MAASEDGNDDMVRKLLSVGMVDVNCANYNGSTPIMKSSLIGNKSIVQMLIGGGADPNKANKFGDNPLQLSAMSGSPEVVRLLLDNGAHPNKATYIYRGTPLHIAAWRGLKDVAQLLLDGGADPKKANAWGDTPLSFAQEKGHMEIEQMMNRKI